MAEPVHIVHWIRHLGLGGDAKNLVLLANEQSKWASVSVLTQTDDSGERVKQLNSGVNVVSGMVASGELSSWIVNAKPDVLIVHRNGAPNSVETAVVEAFYRVGVGCFEYNTFARVDTTTDHLWTGHIHLSRASLVQYAERRAVPPLALVNQKAIGYAVGVTGDTESDTTYGTVSSITNDKKEKARQLLQIPKQAFVVARLVRPDLRKWDPMPVFAVAKLLKLQIPACLVLRAAPDERHAWIKSKLGDSVVFLPPSARDEDVGLTLAASDVVVNYSVIGETFGLAIAEAMMAGLPVVVNSTPQMDNAQIEFCRHGERGLVANSISSLTGALMLLSKDEAKRLELAASGRRFMEKTFAPEVVEARLRRFIIDCLRSAENKAASMFPEPQIEDNYNLTAEWLADYARSENECLPDSSSPIEKLTDHCHLQAARLVDSLIYARKIGLSGIVEKASRRLSQGSLLRG
jgi:glycosyltransferase involved in cell wall biosynthesis